MKVKSVKLQNFGSYKELEFDLQNQGLTLISGPTGAGKSTLMDAIPWVLFGKTSKGGNVDEICTWNNKGSTSGTIYLHDGTIITRSRNPNDLFYNEEIRGKDLKDTQRLIDELLGIDYETYISGAYLHEFSQTAQFFTTNAKNRRQICEQICDLSLVKTLQDKISNENKSLTKSLDEVSKNVYITTSSIKDFERLETSERDKHNTWQLQRDKTIKYIIELERKFENSRKTVTRNECSSCGTTFKEPVEKYDDSPNPHTDKIRELKAEENPYDSGVRSFSKEIHAKKESLNLLKLNENSLKEKIQDFSVLKSAVDTFRTSLISNTIVYIEKETNQRLLKHFDGEIQVTFQAEDMDKLEVEIQKDGNTCSYSQLSKGQRQLLKLCFGTSVMEAISNHKGVHFSELFFDEALDGLDENMKIKAYGLLEEISLNHESVFVVEHSESLKAMFNNTFKVELVNGESRIAPT